MRDPATMPTADQLRDVLHYDPETGYLTWKKKTGPTVKIGVRAGSSGGKFHRYLNVLGVSVVEHRAIWCIATGEWPRNDIDHINGDGYDNRLANLREATASQNQGNAKLSKRNKSGIKGVYWHNTNKKWHALLRRMGKRIPLGFFDSIEDARIAYENGARAEYGEFANPAKNPTYFTKS